MCNFLYLYSAIDRRLALTNGPALLYATTANRIGQRFVSDDATP